MSRDRPGDPAFPRRRLAAAALLALTGALEMAAFGLWAVRLPARIVGELAGLIAVLGATLWMVAAFRRAHAVAWRRHGEDARVSEELRQRLLTERLEARRDTLLGHLQNRLRMAHDAEQREERLARVAEEVRSAEASRQRAAREHERTLGLLDALLETLPAGFILWDEELRCRRINRSAGALMGVVPARELGRSAGGLGAGYASDLVPKLVRVLETGEPLRELEVSGPSASGAEERHWSFSIFPVQGAGGEPAGVAALFDDVTTRRETAAQMREAQRLESIGLLAGGVAHDFNNLLTVINGCTLFALDALAAGHPARPEIEEIGRSAGRAATLTRQLLAFSRRQVLEPEVLDLNALIADSRRMLRRLIGEDVEVVTRLDAALPPALLDPGQVEQVVMNLAVNARDAMPRGGRLTIRTERAELGEEYADTHLEVHAGLYAMLSVADTGTGMDEATRRRVFEPFFTTKGPARGTGLGLSTVYGIVKQSGGAIWVYSEPGAGTTFKLYFPAAHREAVERAGVAAAGSRGSSRAAPAATTPVAPAAATRLDPEAAAPAGGAAPAPPGATAPAPPGATAPAPPGAAGLLPAGAAGPVPEARGEEVVLLVEDDPAVRRLARRALERSRYRVVEAEDPAAALSLVGEGTRFDLLLTDMVMPGMGGRELARRLSGARVLLMSGYTADVVGGEAEPGEVLQFIEKPFTPAALARKVREVLDAPG